MKPSEALTENADVLALPYLLFSIGKNVYGINSAYVQGIETLKDFVTIVDSGPNIRGGVLYQNIFIPLVDLRKLFGLDSQIEEFEHTVQPDQRIRDHENWVSALEKSVHDHSEFTLTDDPHQCAFGRWFYSFKTDNNLLKHQLSAIERPHEAVHDTAKRVKKLMHTGQYEQALSAITELRNTHYKTTLHILSSLRDIVAGSLKELYIIIDSGDGLKGLIVDSVVGIEDLTLLDETGHISKSEFIKQVGQRKKDKSVILIIDNSF